MCWSYISLSYFSFPFSYLYIKKAEESIAFILEAAAYRATQIIFPFFHMYSDASYKHCKRKCTIYFCRSLYPDLLLSSFMERVNIEDRICHDSELDIHWVERLWSGLGLLKILKETKSFHSISTSINQFNYETMAWNNDIPKLKNEKH